MENPPLSRLPAELRNSVYELVLLHDDKYTIDESGRKEFDSEYGVAINEVQISNDHGRTWRPPAILRCCRQLRQEASPIYYSGNIFPVTWDAYEHDDDAISPMREDLGSWLQVLEVVDRVLIRRIGLSNGGFRFTDQVEEQIECDRAYLEEAGVVIGRGKRSFGLFPGSPGMTGK